MGAEVVGPVGKQDDDVCKSVVLEYLIEFAGTSEIEPHEDQ